MIRQKLFYEAFPWARLKNAELIDIGYRGEDEFPAPGPEPENEDHVKEDNNLVDREDLQGPEEDNQDSLEGSAGDSETGESDTDTLELFDEEELDLEEEPEAQNTEDVPAEENTDGAKEPVDSGTNITGAQGEEIPADDKNIPAGKLDVDFWMPKEGWEGGSGSGFFATPSQDVMFAHISRAGKEKRKAMLSIILALVFVAGAATGTIVSFGFLVAGILAAIYGVSCLGVSKKEESLVSDTKHGFLRFEDGVLHCEQGVGTEYEEIQVPADKITETLAFGNMSSRLLAMEFAPADAEMMVNGNKVDEDVFELRGGMYDEKEWEGFVELFNNHLHPSARFDKNAWTEAKSSVSKLPLILGIVFEIASVALRVAVYLGVLVLPF